MKNISFSFHGSWEGRYSSADRTLTLPSTVKRSPFRHPLPVGPFESLGLLPFYTGDHWGCKEEEDVIM